MKKKLLALTTSHYPEWLITPNIFLSVFFCPVLKSYLLIRSNEAHKKPLRRVALLHEITQLPKTHNPRRLIIDTS
jgi:hypothetical protein